MTGIGLVFFAWLFMLGASDKPRADSSSDPYLELRLQMVSKQIQARGVKDEKVLQALRTVPRQVFVPESYRSQAYDDEPLPIGHKQTISQPYIVGLMTELAELDSSSRVLEIGTGSGYQAAVLAKICDSVFSIEIISELAARADSTLKGLGFNVEIRCGDGYRGWPEKAPFDAIIVTAAPDDVPEPLLEQLAEKGRLVIPVGSYYQDLKLIRKIDGHLKEISIIPVRFVPMTGEAEK